MRAPRESIKETVAGSLLLAHPSLRDPNFRRSVVLMSLHNAEGAMGVVLNRPAGKRLAEVTGEFALTALARVPVFHGGPVQPERLVLAAWQARPDGFRLHFGVEPAQATELLSEEGTHVRAFLGYSGWSAGQLENEMQASTWIVADVPGDLLSHPQDDNLWRAVLGREGAEWRLLAGEPEDLERN